MRRPGLLARFHNDGGEILAELVGVNLKPAELGFLERKGESRELLGRAEPNVAALAHLDVRAELLGLPRPGLAVGALRDHHQIGAVELVGVIELMLKSLLYAERGGALLQNAEQHAARDAGESMTAGADGLAFEMHVDVVPVVELIDDARMRRARPLPGSCPWSCRKTRHPSRRCRPGGCARKSRLDAPGSAFLNRIAEYRPAGPPPMQTIRFMLHYIIYR